MKRTIICLVLALTAAATFAQGNFLSNLRFSVATLPEEDGGGFKGELGYSFSDHFASMLYMKRLVTAETGTLDLGKDSANNPAAKESLNLSRNDTTEYFILPVEWSLDAFGPRSLTFGLGAYISVNKVQDVGFFKLSGAPEYTSLPATNSYDSSSKATYFGPVVTVEARLKFLSLNPRIVAVPYFLFSQTQSLQIEPLLSSWGKGSLSYDSDGIPYLAISTGFSIPVGKFIRMDFLSLNGDFSWEFSKQNAQYIQTAATAPNWEGLPVEISTSTITLLPKLSVNFDNGSSITIGAGKRFTTSAQKDGPTVNMNRYVFSLAYDLHK